jgi:hypothetical protein
MIQNQKIRPAKVIGPLGEPLTVDTLPPPSTTRWVVRRKAEVVAAVNGGRDGSARSTAPGCRDCGSPASSITAHYMSVS